MDSLKYFVLCICYNLTITYTWYTFSIINSPSVSKPAGCPLSRGAAGLADLMDQLQEKLFAARTELFHNLINSTRSGEICRIPIMIPDIAAGKRQTAIIY